MFEFRSDVIESALVPCGYAYDQCFEHLRTEPLTLAQSDISNSTCENGYAYRARPTSSRAPDPAIGSTCLESQPALYGCWLCSRERRSSAQTGEHVHGQHSVVHTQYAAYDACTLVARCCCITAKTLFETYPFEANRQLVKEHIEALEHIHPEKRFQGTN